MTNPLSPTEMFASAHSAKCEGPEKCYWCAVPCKRLWLHDDPPQLPFMRKTTNAKYTSSQFICIGCWLFRRKRTTVPFLASGFKDGQAAVYYSWFITPNDCKAITPNDFNALLEVLRNPPRQFTLSLLDRNQINHLHLAHANNHEQVLANSELKFTIDGVLHTYSVYELEQGLKFGFAGKGPGVQALVRYLKLPEPKPPEEKRDRGRPEPLPDSRSIQRPVGKQQQKFSRSGR